MKRKDETKSEKREKRKEKRESSPKVNLHSSFLIPHSPLLIPLIFLLLFTACSTMVQKGGEFLEEGFQGKAINRYQSENDSAAVVEIKELKQNDGKWRVEITNSAWPGLALIGDALGGGGRIELKEARILSSHVHGWNEFSLELLGRAVFSTETSTGAESGVLRIAGEPERVQISSGKIRLKSNYITGSAALTSLRNRRERILALTEWMGGRLNDSDSAVFRNQQEFDNYWKPLLFPELMKKKKRPPEYSGNPAFSGENSEWRRTDSVKWNLSYTEYLFPEELREYRNSGALLRDWEEALAWIFIEYSWDKIIGSINGTTLLKTKK